MTKSDSVRLLATRALYEVLTCERSLSSVMPKYQPLVAPRDQALFQELCFGVCRQLHHMQFWVKHLLNRPLKTRDHDVLAALHLGIYQLLFTRIPDHAAIGETVEVALSLNKPWAKNMLNGVLRNVQRLKKDEVVQSDWQNDPIYRYSHPKWFIRSVQQAWPDQWQTLLEANNSKAPMTLRINKQRVNRADYLQKLQQAGLEAIATPNSDVGITLAAPVDVQQLRGFNEGWVSVQDEAAQLAAPLLQLEPGQRVLDACCAPGGKTCHLLEQQPDLEAVVALDHDEARMIRVKENLQRLGLDAMLKVGNAGRPDSWWDGRPFQRILLDAPCSATGVIRRHPDIKLLRRSSDISALADLQLELLQAVWKILETGGILLYATCSVLPQENEQVIERFLAETGNAQHDEIDASWGNVRPFGRQLFPAQGNHDGFYYARLIKES